MVSASVEDLRPSIDVLWGGYVPPRADDQARVEQILTPHITGGVIAALCKARVEVRRASKLVDDGSRCRLPSFDDLRDAYMAALEPFAITEKDRRFVGQTLAVLSRMVTA